MKKYMSVKLALQSNGKNKLLKIVNQSNFFADCHKTKEKKICSEFRFLPGGKKESE